MKGEIHFYFLFSVFLFFFIITLIACDTNNIPISTTKNTITENTPDDNNYVVSRASCSNSPCQNFDCDSCEHYCIELRGSLPGYDEQASGSVSITGYDCSGKQITCSYPISWPGNPWAWGNILPHGRFRIFCMLDDGVSRRWEGYSDVILDYFGMHPSNKIYLDVYFY